MESQISINIAPERPTAGSSILWSEVFKKSLVKCGTAKPTKAIGPAKAVIAPAKIQVAKMIQSVARFK